MVILESREQLVKQLEEAWAIIAQASEALSTAQEALDTAHTNLKAFSRRVNGQGTVEGTTRVESAPRSTPRGQAQTGQLQRVPAVRKEYVLRAGRNPARRDDIHLDAESGC